MFILKKCCFFFPLKWGMLAIAIFHVVFGSLAVAAHTVHHPEDIKYELYLNLNMLLIQIIGCILLIVSIWVKKSLLAICFLLSDIIFMIWVLVVIIYCFWEKEYLAGAVLIFFTFVCIYLWVCVSLGIRSCNKTKRRTENWRPDLIFRKLLILTNV